MLIGDDRLSPDRAGTCSATSPETVCPRCGRGMAIAKTGLFEVVASFACGCARVDLSFLDLSHGQATIWHVEAALFALWGERGAAAAAALLAPDVARARC